MRCSRERVGENSNNIKRKIWKISADFTERVLADDVFGAYQSLIHILLLCVALCARTLIGSWRCIVRRCPSRELAQHSQHDEIHIERRCVLRADGRRKKNSNSTGKKYRSVQFSHTFIASRIIKSFQFGFTGRI